MAIYLYDFENVGPHGLNGIEKLDKSDKIILFYFNSKPEKINKLLQNSKVQKEFIKQSIHTKNSLDFKIVGYIGMHIKDNNNFVILSRDKGYESAIEFFKSQKPNINIVETSTINGYKCNKQNNCVNSTSKGIIKQVELLNLTIERELEVKTLIKYNQDLGS